MTSQTITSFFADSCFFRTWLFLSGFGQVGDTGVWTHEYVAWVQRPLQKQLLGLGEVDATQGSLWQRVGGHQSQAVHAHLVDTVYCLEKGFGQSV